ncbi:hypothetical protein DACRYDRAFT_58247 [Dacryopinax primogenitus]|uniref:Uncharacterized protein n=1 Tax=Dacryopinax primogenitus (strain DJM 731) TaxID=1858805 RepID=M5FQS3_DACPD|nr:uncharacterized protein DACRYDRAFT_58247 [Dacryopinax primogenitus]EJT97918.1 hypothetical protein DACRYDRAFT_58247 [Dacryopinax primogenitus]
MNSSQYCVHGIIAIVCCHNVLLHLTNLVDTGEKHFYTVALVQKVMDQLHTAATVGILYDIACQLHRSVRKVCTNSIPKNNTHSITAQADARA